MNNIEALKTMAWKGDTEAAFVLRAIARENDDKELLAFLLGVRDYHKITLKNQYDTWSCLLEDAYKLIYCGMAYTSHRVSLIKRIRTLTNWGLKESKEFSDRTTPEALPMVYSTKEEADEIAKELTALGARVVIRAYETIVDGNSDIEDLGYA